MDLVEKPEAIVLKAELPGIEKENVHVERKNNILILRG